MPGNAGPIDATSVRYVVTLVHGTFATGAPWMNEDSTLSKALRHQLGEGLKILPFNWTGKNSPAARQQASADLAAQLAVQVKDYKNAAHYVVSHSHGGALALSAVVKLGVLEKIAGVVCMATPFLVARERDLGRGRVETFVGVILSAAIAGALILDALLAPLPWPETLRAVVKAMALLALILGTVLGLLGWQKRAQRLLEELASEVAVDPRKVLIVRTPADEASGFLIVGQFVSQLTVRVYLAAQRLTARIEAAATRWSRHRWTLAGVTAGEAVVTFLFLIASAEASNRGLPVWLVNLPLAGFFATVICLILTLVILVPVYGVPGATAPFRILVSFLTWPTIVILSLFLVLPFGLDVAVANILLDVTAETTPPGSWTVHMFPAPTARELGRDDVPLMHSVVYENPRALAFIADWIAQKQK